MLNLYKGKEALNTDREVYFTVKSVSYVEAKPTNFGYYYIHLNRMDGNFFVDEATRNKILKEMQEQG